MRRRDEKQSYPPVSSRTDRHAATDPSIMRDASGVRRTRSFPECPHEETFVAPQRLRSLMKHSALLDQARPPGKSIAADGCVVDLVSRQVAGVARVVVQATIDEAADRAALRAGLIATPAHSSPKFFYDAQGSSLFTAICELDEYYPTRTEARIFDIHGDAITRALPADSQWIDLGCGDGAKARGWLDRARVRRYVGVDIAEPWLRASLATLASERARGANTRDDTRAQSGPLSIVGVVTDFTRPFDLHAVLAEEPDMPPVFFYPGSSIGNFVHDDARAFLVSVREHIECHSRIGGKTSGRLLIGVDLVKDRAVLHAAYDDALGVTAAFNRNVLRVANNLLDADFDPGAFEHRAVFDEAASRIEMQLVAVHAQTVRIGSDARHFEKGEVIVTEYSHKYTVESFSDLLEAAGFATGERLRCWTDERNWFAVFVADPA